MGSITSAFCSSAKGELLGAGHCFQGVVTPTATTSTNFVLTSASSLSGVAVGMTASGSGIASGSIVASIDSATQCTLSKATTASASGVTITFTGDTFKIALFANTVSGTYGAANVNYTDMGADETSGTAYSAGGVALTNVSPVISGTTGFVNFSPNPSWTSATFSTSGCMIYNSSCRLGGTSGSNTQGAGRSIGVFNYGSQTVTAGVLTVLFPSATSSTAIFRIA